jgi:hypothetical protein
VLPDGLFVNFPHSKFLYDISRFYLRKSYRAPSYERLFLEGKKGSYAGLFLANVDVDELCTGAGLGASTGDGLRCGADEVVGLLDDAAAVGLGLLQWSEHDRRKLALREQRLVCMLEPEAQPQVVLLVQVSEHSSGSCGRVPLGLCL